jgi:multidrug efflux pump subunit AcrA (membrane-fusion protein)
MLVEAQAESARRAVAENQVRLSEARTTLGRRAQLLKDRVASQAEVDETQAAVDSFDARLNAARQQVQVAERQIDVQRSELDSTVIRAPFSGIVISKTRPAKWCRGVVTADSAPASAPSSTCGRRDRRRRQRGVINRVTRGRTSPPCSTRIR